MGAPISVYGQIVFKLISPPIIIITIVYIATKLLSVEEFEYPDRRVIISQAKK